MLLRSRLPKEALSPNLPGAGTVDGTFALRAQMAGLVVDLRALPERQRAALVLRQLYELSYRDIGDLLGIRAGAARESVLQARRSLLTRAEGRERDCGDIRLLLSDGRARRAVLVRAHLEACASCRAAHHPSPAARIKSLLPLPEPIVPPLVLRRSGCRGARDVRHRPGDHGRRAPRRRRPAARRRHPRGRAAARPRRLPGGREPRIRPRARARFGPPFTGLRAGGVGALRAGAADGRRAGRADACAAARRRRPSRGRERCGPRRRRTPDPRRGHPCVCLGRRCVAGRGHGPSDRAAAGASPRPAASGGVSSPCRTAAPPTGSPTSSSPSPAPRSAFAWAACGP